MCLIFPVALAALGGCGVITIDRGGAQTTGAPSSSQVTALPDFETTEPQGGTAASGAPESTPAPDVYEPTSRKYEAEARLEALRKKYDIDLSDTAITVVAATNAECVVCSSDTSPMYSVTEERDKMIKEAFGCDIYYTFAEAETIRRELSEAVKKGDYYADLLVLSDADAKNFYAEGLLKPLSQLPFYGETGTAYADSSSAADYADGTYVLFFNKALAGSELTESLYSRVLNGKWTWEAFIAVLREYSANGDISLAIGNGEKTALGRVLAARSRSSRTAAAYSAQISGAGLYASTKEKSGKELFGEGKALFFMSTLSDGRASELFGTDMGLLPLPCDEDVVPCVVEIESRPVICVAANTVRLEGAGLVLLAMDAAGGEWLNDRYAEGAVRIFLRDNDSFFTLRAILAERERSLG